MELSKVTVQYVEYFVLLKEDSRSPPQFVAGPFTDLNQLESIYSKLEEEGEMVLLGTREVTAELDT